MYGERLNKSKKKGTQKQKEETNIEKVKQYLELGSRKPDPWTKSFFFLLPSLVYQRSKGPDVQTNV